MPEIAQLQRVLDEPRPAGAGQFVCDVDEEPLIIRTPRKMPSDITTTPHDPEVRYGHKGDTGWVGYKLQVTETVDAPSPVAWVTGESPARFITDVAITPATEVDNRHLPSLQARLAARGLAPGKQYVDQGYMSADNLVTSRERGIELYGFIKADTSSKPPGFRLEDFYIDVEQQLAICPSDCTPTYWHISKPNPQNLVAQHIFFGVQCQDCVFFGPGLCTDKPGGRHLSLNQHHAVIQARRREARTDAFKREMRMRAGTQPRRLDVVEGSIS